MEDNKSDSTSDRDKKMMGSFESYSTKREKAEKAKEAEEEKKRLRRLPGLFERPEDAQDSEEDKEKTDIGALFEKKERETDDEETDEAAETTSNPEEEEGHEANGTLEELDQEEVEAAIDQYVEAQLPEVEAEVEAGDPDSGESDVARAEATLLRNIKETHSVEEGFKKTVEDLDLDEEDIEEGSAEAADDHEGDQEADDEEAELAEDEEEETSTSAKPLATTYTPPPPRPTPTTPPIPPLYTPPNSFNVPPTPNTQPAQQNTDPSHRRRRAGDVLVGGIIGYLIGRRRGRINTEAELIPVKNKLESEVRQLHEEIADKEDKIRKLATEKFEKTKEEKPLLQQRIENEDQQEALTRRSYESINQSDYAKTRPERLGHVLVPQVELEPEKPDVSKLSIVELLGIAANIKRDNVSVRQMFESGRLDALGLRRVVHEYLDGQNIERVLAENLKMMESREHISNPVDSRQTDKPTFAHHGAESVSGPLSLPKSVDTSYGSQSYPSAAPDYYQIELQKRRAAVIGIGIGLTTAVLVLVALYLLI